MNNFNSENNTNNPDMGLSGGLSVEIDNVAEGVTYHNLPNRFSKIGNEIIKAVSLYLQLLWNANPNGKSLEYFSVKGILDNAKSNFHNQKGVDFYVVRYIASDLREISLKSGFEDRIKRWFKVIEHNRLDIQGRMELTIVIEKYFGSIIHYELTEGYNSYEKVNEINNLLSRHPDQLKFNLIELCNKDEYLMPKYFNKIFEDICIVFIMNYFFIFEEFLYNE